MSPPASDVMAAPVRPAPVPTLTPRQVSGRLHRWLGLTIGTIVTLLGLTGSILVFRAEIDRGLNPGLFDVVPSGDPRPFGQLVTMTTTQTGLPVLRITVPARSDEAYRLELPKHREAFVDPYQGRILGIRNTETHTMARLLGLHRRLLAGDIGNWIIGIGAAGLVVTVLSGIVLWFPRRLRLWRHQLTIRRGTWRSLMFSGHQALGAYATFGLLLLGSTGTAFAFRDAVLPVYSLITASSTKLPVPAVLPPNGTVASLDAIVRTARAQFPTAVLSAVHFPKKPTEPYRIVLRQPGEPHPLGRTAVFVDPTDAVVRGIQDPFTAPLAWRLYYSYNFALHTGEIFGWPTRLLVLMAALTPAPLFVSGLLIWRSKRKQAPAPASKTA